MHEGKQSRKVWIRQGGWECFPFRQEDSGSLHCEHDIGAETEGQGERPRAPEARRLHGVDSCSARHGLPFTCASSLTTGICFGGDEGTAGDPPDTNVS